MKVTTPTQVAGDGTLSKLTRPILIAGVLGGVLGGVTSFAASRVIKPANPEVIATAKEAATEDARHVVEEFLSLLKADRRDEFMEQVKHAYTALTHDEYLTYKKNLDNFRTISMSLFGQPLHEFELLSETALNPDLIQYVYLERYDHGAVIWRFIMYRGKDRWWMSFLHWSEKSHDAFTP